MDRVLAYFCAILIGLGILLPVALPAQDSESGPPKSALPKKTAPAADIFSGTVTKLTEDSVTVIRKVLGHESVTREFTRDAETKVEGKLRERMRVTVRYKADDDGGFIAVYIIVR